MVFIIAQQCHIAVHDSTTIDWQPTKIDKELAKFLFLCTIRKQDGNQIHLRDCRLGSGVTFEFCYGLDCVPSTFIYCMYVGVLTVTVFEIGPLRR